MTKIAVTIRIDKDVWKATKRVAIDLDMKIGSFVETAILHQITSLKQDKTPSNKGEYTQ